jgi:hypothetical protein
MCRREKGLLHSRQNYLLVDGAPYGSFAPLRT